MRFSLTFWSLACLLALAACGGHGVTLAAAGADTARMLRPDSMITKEYMMGRLNVVVDRDNRIVRVDCG